MSTTTADWRDRFIAHLEDLKARDDRAALADLRRGLGEPPGTVASMYRHVIPWIPANQFIEDTAYIVASLFAFHPVSGGARTVGTALAAIHSADGSSRPESIERRFTTLLSAHEDDLQVHLRQAISLLKVNDIPLDWRTSDPRCPRLGPPRPVRTKALGSGLLDARREPSAFSR